MKKVTLVISKRKPRKSEIICVYCDHKFNPFKASQSVSGYIQCPDCGHYLNKEDYQPTTKKKKLKITNE